MDKSKKKQFFYYECVRCNYNSDSLYNMKKHQTTKKKCKNVNNNTFSEEIQNNMSLVKKIKDEFLNNNNNNNISITENQEFEIGALDPTHLSESLKELPNKDDINNNLKNINKNNNDQNNDQNNEKELNGSDQNNNNIDSENEKKNKKCSYCNKILCNKQNLDKHMEICKKNPNYYKNIQQQSLNTINFLTNNQINLVNNNIVNNNSFSQNNLIININNDINDNKEIDKILIPFFDKFDTSHINDEVKMSLLFSHLYFDTLKEILKNKVNLNFLINTNSESSFIYKNKTENITKIDNIIIYNNVWKKVRDYLLESFENIKKKYPRIEKSIYELTEGQIKKKYNDFILDNNKEYTKNVIATINLASEENKDETEKIFKTFNNLLN